MNQEEEKNTNMVIAHLTQMNHQQLLQIMISEINKKKYSKLANASPESEMQIKRLIASEREQTMKNEQLRNQNQQLQNQIKVLQEQNDEISIKRNMAIDEVKRITAQLKQLQIQFQKQQQKMQYLENIIGNHIHGAMEEKETDDIKNN